MRDIHTQGCGRDPAERPICACFQTPVSRRTIGSAPSTDSAGRNAADRSGDDHCCFRVTGARILGAFVLAETPMPEPVVPIAIATPGWSQIAWVCLLAFLPLVLALACARIAPHRAQALPPSVRGGTALGLGIAGAMAATLGSWVISSNGAWHDGDNFHLRASRAFYIELPLDELHPERARPIAFDALVAEGRIRTPGYAAGAYRDAEGRRIFVLWAGAPLTRIPTDRDFDIAVAIADPAALR